MAPILVASSATRKREDDRNCRGYTHLVQAHYEPHDMFAFLFREATCTPAYKSGIMSTTQAPLTTRPINDILPVEILLLIFEEHAKLEWRAPMIDGEVCRLWRQMILNAPRVWGYLEINENNRDSIDELRLWSRRSGSAPLHIHVSGDSPFSWDIPVLTPLVYNILCEHHARIASLRMSVGKLSFFEGRDFPSLRHLNIKRWADAPSRSAQWGHMPQLRSLRLGVTNLAVTPLNGLFSLKSLALDCTNCAFLPRHSLSLTTLMLEDVSLKDIVLGPVSFPSLTYLSLYNVTGLKPHIDAPHLATYHEGGTTMTESFPTPLQSITEYGVFYQGTIVPDLTKWHPNFTTVSRLSIRAHSPVLVEFLDSLARHPHVLPALRTISVRGMVNSPRMAAKRLMLESVSVRSTACQMKIALYFEKAQPSWIPIFLGHVSHQPIT